MALPVVVADAKGRKRYLCVCGVNYRAPGAKSCSACYSQRRRDNSVDSTGKCKRARGECIDCSASLSDTYRLYCQSCSHKAERNHKWKGGVSKMPGYSSQNENRRRAAKNKTEKHYTHAEWESLKEKFGYMCLCCKAVEPDIKLTVDHIIPLSKGGDNSFGNIQPLCFPCNLRKYNKTINYLTV